VAKVMGNKYRDKKGYPRWKDSKKLVHRTVVHPKVGTLFTTKMETKAISEEAIWLK
jgi:hypothetical protein